MTAKYTFFGAAWRQVVARLGGTEFNVQDFASLTATVDEDSTASVLKVDSTDGLAAGQKININTGDFPEQGETRTIESVDSATQFTVGEAFSSAPAAGDVVNDGPEQLEAAMAWAEAEVEAQLPSRYRALLSRVEGEVIVRRATAGQTTATLCNIALPFAAAPTGVVLYRNYRGEWPDRTASDAMAASEFSLDGRAVTFTGALAEGDQVVAEYGHALAAAPRVLRDLLIDLAAWRAAQRAQLGHDAGPAAWVNSLRDSAAARLESMATGTPPRGIPEFDDLALIDDWRRERARGVGSGSIHLV